MTQRFLSAHPRCPLRGHRVYGAKRRCDTPLLAGPPIGGLLYFEFLSDSYPPAPLRHFVALFAPLGSVSLDSQVALLPYSTAITDSLDSQVAIAPLRIQFAGVTPVPLPPKGDARESNTILPELTPLPSAHSAPADGVAGVSAAFPLPSAKESSAVLSTKKAVKSTGFHSFSIFISPGLSRGPPRGRMPLLFCIP